MSAPAPRDANDPPRLRKFVHYTTNLLIVAVIRLALALPYGLRVRFVGWLVQHVIGPVAGYRKRALDNLALIHPEMGEDQRQQIASACLNNVGRSFIENYSARDFPARMAKITPEGPGVAALEEAAVADRPVILVTGHFGNYEATRAALVARGFDIGGLYRDMKNPYFNAHYVKTMEAFGGPVFPQGRKGTAGFVRHLKGGGQLVLLFDQHVMYAPILDFMGEPARTALSAAELALRYDALLIPFYGIRQPDGLSFQTLLEAPVPHSDAQTMTQAINDSLAAQVAKRPEQWFWVHRRWRSHEP
ncbi:lauroyl acyltransferase [Sulfitobacter mediterraneus]|uniref:lysophospholipid acyltransferase family protein n=1 Tax=Sulfitobacter mediterraneus TaxID=83219 RepID=UPI001931E627|nr:lauroyl acyltransferase [Sulfitobacter mediterraneus]MBM1311833.1 lauroyl acyltransferase [Sulfitobacter mediterraneus]MBM1315714.1 lauroyl acyltransferase [Sulfitobacter mediterraneus]MBM1324076.1 lauroyl acyltransferase [Sulfitobacter mediterraneus]MBM1327988.1 lauroyl acyltransferase [Sulfitobacter mediterraneus]MBM1399336.1 lauroyl acyltransferase [Sulfitobacter mediterraneus]